MMRRNLAAVLVVVLLVANLQRTVWELMFVFSGSPPEAWRTHAWAHTQHLLQWITPLGVLGVRLLVPDRPRIWVLALATLLVHPNLFAWLELSRRCFPYDLWSIVLHLVYG